MARQIKKGRKSRPSQALPFTKTNYIIFLVGLILLVLGNICLSKGPWNSFWSLDLAPVLLVFAYVVVIPVAILYHKKDRNSSAEETNT
ncbi:hypothetical protein DRQ07_05115 [candidate division KSB1 bacterium]|nr:MAG: hypothetical protein DRQ07_05115 [candidate division KSB1 bacterium]